MIATSQPIKRFRFAPSPNGPLHLGHAYSVLRNLDIAAHLGGEVLLRIDDIDQTRARVAHECSIIRDCAWLGLRTTEPLRRQSQHLTDYQTALQKLDNLGLVYKAYASRKAVQAFVQTQPHWPRDPDGAPHYPRKTAFLMPNHEGPTSIRLDMAKALDRAAAQGPLHMPQFDPQTGAVTPIAVDPSLWGDVALATRDVPASYHLAVVVDDAAQGITHIVRGADLEAATAIHILLQRLLGLESAAYHHHALILGADGRKLSKSLKAESLSDWRMQGHTAQTMRPMLQAQLQLGDTNTHQG